MARKPTVHVVPTDSGWGVKVSGQPYYQTTTQNKTPAVEAAISVAKVYQTELRIHNLNGQIGETRSYGNDDCPPRDRR